MSDLGYVYAVVLRYSLHDQPSRSRRWRGRGCPRIPVGYILNVERSASTEPDYFMEREGRKLGRVEEVIQRSKKKLGFHAFDPSKECRKWRRGY